MLNLTVTDATFVFLIFVLAGFVKGVAGMGLPTVAMGLLSVVVPPPAAASLLLLPSFLTNVWQFVTGPGRMAVVRRFWPFAAGVAVGTVAAAGMMVGAAARHATVGLGVALLLYALYGLSGRKLAVSQAAERWLAAPVGLATGLVTGATGVFVIPSAPYLQALELDREELIQALGLSFTVSTIALGGGLSLAGGLDGPALASSALVLIPTALGLVAGQSLRRRIPATTFQRVFLVGLLLLGLFLILGV